MIVILGLFEQTFPTKRSMLCEQSMRHVRCFALASMMGKLALQAPSKKRTV